MAEELKPCPFCGIKPAIFETFGIYHVRCINPKCLMKPDTWLTGENSQSKHIKAWNKRAE